MSYKPKGKLRPATPADLVEGNKIIVEEANGAFVKGTVVQSLSKAAGIVHIHDIHTYGSTEAKHVEEDYGWSFSQSDFEDGRHGDYGLKLWVEEVAEQATETLTCVTGDYGTKISYVEVHDAKGKQLWGRLEGIRRGDLMVRVPSQHFTTGMNSYTDRLWVIEASDFVSDGEAQVCGIRFLFVTGEA